MPSTDAPRIALVPEQAPAWMAEAITAGGGHLVAPEAAEGLVWGSPVDADGLAAALRRAPGVRWVQLPWAGVERFVHLMDDDRLWTCGKGVYAEPVAEMVITLALAGMRGLGTYARARSWQKPQGTNLLGARVTILGGGGITESLLRLLRPFDCHVTVVRNRAQDMDVTDPEPLPEGHPLWSLPNCIITPHVANTPDMAQPLLAERITENVRHFGRGEELIGPVDPELGY